MKYIDEYRDRAQTTQYLDALKKVSTRQWTVMEVCGGQTHTLLKYGIDEVLPQNISLLHGPGCPVCVTPVYLIDKAITLALREDLILCTFGDMIRVPGSEMDLQHVKARGGDVRIAMSPLDAVHIARSNPDQEVVFFAIGFETTAPATAMAVKTAHQHDIANFSLLVSHMLIPPAIEVILSNPDRMVHAFLAPGHVCTVTGIRDYEILAQAYKTPFVVTGFEPIDLLQGIFRCIRQLEEQRAEVEIQYSRSVKPDGNLVARELIDEVYKTADREWRGLGTIERSGLTLREQFHDFDAERKFQLLDEPVLENDACIMGLVLQGLKKPFECPSFESLCTPETPLGAPMVSSEGACAAYFRYKKKT